MTVERILPTPEAYDLLDLVRDIADRELAPRAADFEARGEFPRDVLRILGRAGLFGLPYDEEYGGGGQPYEVYLQVLEEVAARWLVAAEAISVHTLSCYPVTAYGTDAQRKRHLPDMLGGDLLGAYCLSEPQSWSDAAALRTRAVRDAGLEVDLLGERLGRSGRRRGGEGREEQGAWMEAEEEREGGRGRREKREVIVD